jgi:hypothetical protein
LINTSVICTPFDDQRVVQLVMSRANAGQHS